MKKVKLDLSSLKVETFAAGEDLSRSYNAECTFGNCSIPCILPTCEEYAC